ncbi:hypothetical protein Ahy_B03g062205 isoform D [Arachis hypogaea]|uniref:Uncharacterized protein n=1 Tax=Arachis hypogaea TaxID=3818 RepID=A0A444ZTJ7_ARAHY|nr:hypothetical protein Ahy_B03g062205 isoform D [Arachis hypogaea]
MKKESTTNYEDSIIETEFRLHGSVRIGGRVGTGSRGSICCSGSYGSSCLGSLPSPVIKLNETPGGKYGLRHQIMRSPCIQRPDSRRCSILHFLRVQRTQQAVPQYPQNRL